MRVKAIRISKWCSLCLVYAQLLKHYSTKQKFILFGGVVKDLNNICEIYHL